MKAGDVISADKVRVGMTIRAEVLGAEANHVEGVVTEDLHSEGYGYMDDVIEVGGAVTFDPDYFKFTVLDVGPQEAELARSVVRVLDGFMGEEFASPEDAANTIIDLVRAADAE